MMNHHIDLNRWVQGARRLVAVALLLLGLGLGTTPAQAQGAIRSYDHVKTGFLLTGVHASQRCESCHVNGVFRGTPRDCASCHTVGARLAAQNVVKPQQHFPTQLGCESCHTSVSFSGAKFNHMGVAPTSCASCHNGMTASGKPSGHIMTTASCGTCHRTTAWLPAMGMDHSLFTMATNCASCHNGGSATGKSGTHIPTTVNCINCHNTIGWRPTKWNHSQQPVANQCSSCHSGAYPPASGRPSNHIPYQMLTGVAITNCDTCHMAGYATWYPGRFHSNVSITTQCATCHLSSVYGLTSKPLTATHATVTGNCESCHRSTSSWLSVQFTHSPANAVGTGTCDTCHNGVTALGKPPTHIPVPAGIAKCDSCHRSQVSFATSFSMNHAVVTTGTCKSCHNGNYLSVGTQGALAKPVNHIPEVQLLNGASMDCKDCHTGTVSWTALAMNHNNSMGSGAGWCTACHATGTSYQGNIQRMALNHRGGTTVKVDCSQSGCHRPLGNTGSTYRNWN